MLTISPCAHFHLFVIKLITDSLLSITINDCNNGSDNYIVVIIVIIIIIAVVVVAVVIVVVI